MFLNSVSAMRLSKLIDPRSSSYVNSLKGGLYRYSMCTFQLDCCCETQVGL